MSACYSCGEQISWGPGKTKLRADRSGPHICDRYQQSEAARYSPSDLHDHVCSSCGKAYQRIFATCTHPDDLDCFECAKQAQAETAKATPAY